MGTERKRVENEEEGMRKPQSMADIIEKQRSKSRPANHYMNNVMAEKVKKRSILNHDMFRHENVNYKERVWDLM